MERGRARLVPLRVQLHADVAATSDAEYAEFAEWWLHRLRHAHQELGDLSDAQIDGLPCGLSGGLRLGEVKFEGQLVTGFPLMVNAIQGQGADLRASWSSLPLRAVTPLVSVFVKVWDSGLERITGECAVWFGAHAEPETIARVESALHAMLVDVVERWNPSFANLTDDSEAGIPSGMAMECAIPRSTPPEVLERRRLRSYSWTTFVCPEIASRLGGAAAMIESGAFWQVEEVRNGLVLQATEHLADFAGEPVRAVHDVLAPVLRTGATHGPHMLTGGLRILWDDGRAGPFDYGRLQRFYERTGRNGAWAVSSS
jgi:hypothetical protein